MASDTSASTTANPTPSGSGESSRRTSEQRLAELDVLLNQYEESVGLPAFRFAEGDDEAREFLDLTSRELREMTAEDCAVAAVILRQFARRLQRAVNIESSRVRWAQENLRRMTAPVLPQVWGWNPDERWSQAVRQDEACKKVDELRVKAQLRIERIGYLAAKVSDQADSLDRLNQTKRQWRD